MTDNRLPIPKLRLAFMGTPDFAVPALEQLRAAGHDIAAVYTQPPRPKGRGYEVAASPVHEYALGEGLPVFHPRSLRKEDERKKFAELNLDLAVVAAYGLILPKAILDAPKYGCINIHASLLPRWRGASPIQRAIWSGDEESGVTLMQMDEGLDTGPMIMKRAVKIRPTTTASSLHDELSAFGAAMITEAVKELAAHGHLHSELQPENGVTYASLLKKEDGRVNWTHSAAEIDRQIRALNPWPGVWSDVETKRVKIFEAAPLAETTKEPPGTILSRDGKIACGGGSVLAVSKIQSPGGKAMDFSSALNGGHLKLGGKFV